MSDRAAGESLPAGVPVQKPVTATPPAALPAPETLRQELTWQSVIGALLVASTVSLSYPYIVLKLGLGPNVSLLSAFLGALFLSVTARRTHGRNRLMNNIIQTAGTSATSTAFMCVVAAAFGYLGMNRSVDVHVEIGPWQMFTWLICSGTIGVLFVPVFRRYFLSDPKMIFPDGVSAAETILVLDSNTAEARGKLLTLNLGLFVSAIISFVENGLSWLAPIYFSTRFQLGLDWSLLPIGTGMIVGLRVGLSMLLGTALIALFGPLVIQNVGLEIVNQNLAPADIAPCGALVGVATLTAEQTAFLNQRCGMLGSYLKGNDFSLLLLWTMWPATALLLASGLTAVAMQWRSIVSMLRGLARRGPGTDGANQDISLRSTLIGVALLTVLLAYVQNIHFGMSYLETFVAVLFELPLILIGVRILGETDFGPVSVNANALQVIFAAFWPNNIAHNLIAAGMAGDGNSQAEGTMQDFKTGEIVGSTPRVLTIVQMCAIPIGAAAVAIMYPLLIAHYGLGGNGLTAPTGLKLANMAVLLSKGFSAFPAGALEATVAAAILGVLLTVFGKRYEWLPSPAGLGFSLILPGLLTIAIALGAVIGWLWQRYAPTSYDRYHITLASGFIGGDAIISGILLPALAYFNVLPSG